MDNLSFKHSGRLGDIIYALPLIKAMVERNKTKADMYILNDDYYEVKGAAFHPGQGVTVSQPLFDYISPLLNAIAYIDKVTYCSNGEVPKDAVDLDSFKKQKFNLLASGNQVWYRKAHSIPVAIEKKWIIWKDDIKLPELPAYNVLFNKSTRYYNKSLNYKFLDEIDNVGFIGLEMEYEDFKKRNQLVNLKHVPTRDSLDIAVLLNNCNVYISNQSLGFAIAEGLKIPRAIEVYEPVPVVIPIGGVCIDFVRTEQIVSFLKEYFSMKILGTYIDREGGFVECVLTEKPVKLSRRIRNFVRKLRKRNK